MHVPQATPELLLRDAKTIAVVGMSKHPSKPAHNVPAILKEAGYNVIGINPTAQEILGDKVYPSLTDVSEPIDIVDIFRPGPQTPKFVQQAIDIGAKSVWLQLGITSKESRQLALDAGLDYVEDRCTAIVLEQIRETSEF